MFNKGDVVRILVGEDAGDMALVYKVYTIEDIVSVAVKLAEDNIHMYKPEDLELVE